MRLNKIRSGYLDFLLNTEYSAAMTSFVPEFRKNIRFRFVRKFFSAIDRMYGEIVAHLVKFLVPK